MNTDPPCTWAQAIEDGHHDEVDALENEIMEVVSGEDVGISAPALAFALAMDILHACSTHDDARATFEGLVIKMRAWIETGIQNEREELH